MERKAVSVVRVFFRLHGWLFLIPLAVALLFAAVQRSESTNARLLAEQGLETIATVVAKNRNSRSGSSGYDYYIIYRFEADGIEYDSTQIVSADFYESVSWDEERPVRYVRTDPTISEVESRHAAKGAVWTGVVAAIAALVALAFLMWKGRLIRSALRAGRHGAVREARITAHVPTAIVVAGKRRYRLA